MKVEKKVLEKLTKCYSVAPLRYRGKDHLLVAAEKVDRCLLFSTAGELEDTVWSEPGGTMSIVQAPGSDGQFLATHRFYSPNDSKDASIVVVTPGQNGWTVKTLVKLPFVHRFDIVERNGVRWLIACTLKSGHEYKDDWRSPGKVYAARLPEDLSGFDEKNQLELRVVMDGLTHDHGYFRYRSDGFDQSVISADEGVFLFAPPAEGEEWTVKKLIHDPTSDALLCDLDGDGVPELAAISPFHGDTVRIYKNDGGYRQVYEYPQPAEFAHAICCGEILGRQTLIVGHRKGKRDLLAFYWDGEQYVSEVLDSDVGPANALCFHKDGQDRLLSANRETDEIALYTFLKD